MCLTEEEGQYDTAFMMVCAAKYAPKGQCICGYHEYDGVEKCQATDEDMASIKKMLEPVDVQVSVRGIDWPAVLRALEFPDDRFFWSQRDQEERNRKLAAFGKKLLASMPETIQVWMDGE